MLMTVWFMIFSALFWTVWSYMDQYYTREQATFIGGALSMAISLVMLGMAATAPAILGVVCVATMLFLLVYVVYRDIVVTTRQSSLRSTRQ